MRFRATEAIAKIWLIICTFVIVFIIVPEVMNTNQPSKVNAGEAMVVVGEVINIQVVPVFPGESRWAPSEIIAASETVVGFQHANGIIDNLVFCEVELRLERGKTYKLYLEGDRSDINIGDHSTFSRGGICWRPKSVERY